MVSLPEAVPTPAAAHRLGLRFGHPLHGCHCPAPLLDKCLPLYQVLTLGTPVVGDSPTLHTPGRGVCKCCRWPHPGRASTRSSGPFQPCRISLEAAQAHRGKEATLNRGGKVLPEQVTDDTVPQDRVGQSPLELWDEAAHRCPTQVG